LISWSLADQHQAAGQPAGFVNPALYGLYRNNAFRDVSSAPAGSGLTLGDVINYDAAREDARCTRWPSPPGLQATPGYDDVTGLGSDDGAT
jgi:hypothetical protein